jgi:hypothetical protein
MGKTLNLTGNLLRLIQSWELERHEHSGGHLALMADQSGAESLHFLERYELHCLQDGGDVLVEHLEDGATQWRCTPADYVLGQMVAYGPRRADGNQIDYHEFEQWFRAWLRPAADGANRKVRRR